MIKPGWDVFAVDGTKLGEVDVVEGNDTTDIFDGLSIATSALGTPRYVAAERVARIEDGSVHLSLTSSQLDQLHEYLEPEATSAPTQPTQQHEHSTSLWGRIERFFRPDAG
jgi:hypothetical protein